MRIGYAAAQPLPDHYRAPIETRQKQPAVTRAVSAEQSSSLELTLTTADGDKVTLSAQALQSFASETAPGRRTTARASQLSLSVNVEGDLDQQELQDIRKLAIALGKSVRQAEGGHVAQAIRTVAKAADQDSIAAFQFRYERKTELEYRQNAYQQVSDLA